MKQRSRKKRHERIRRQVQRRGGQLQRTLLDGRSGSLDRLVPTIGLHRNGTSGTGSSTRLRIFGRSVQKLPDAEITLALADRGSLLRVVMQVAFGRHHHHRRVFVPTVIRSTSDGSSSLSACTPRGSTLPSTIITTSSPFDETRCTAGDSLETGAPYPETPDASAKAAPGCTAAVGSASSDGTVSSLEKSIGPSSAAVWACTAAGTASAE